MVKRDKTYISTALAADALIHKDINKIIVTRPVLQAEEDLGFYRGYVRKVCALLSPSL